MGPPNLLPIPWAERDTRSVPTPDEVRTLERIAALPRNYKKGTPSGPPTLRRSVGHGQTRAVHPVVCRRQTM